LGLFAAYFSVEFELNNEGYTSTADAVPFGWVKYEFLIADPFEELLRIFAIEGMFT
jgi:hypothetical protein